MEEARLLKLAFQPFVEELCTGFELLPPNGLIVGYSYDNYFGLSFKEVSHHFEDFIQAIWVDVLQILAFENLLNSILLLLLLLLLRSPLAFFLCSFFRESFFF
jgi:hypothetical protein